MKSHDSNHFPAPETLLLGFHSPKTANFTSSLFALLQALPYLPPPAQSLLESEVLHHPPSSPGHLPSWLEAVFFIGGSKAEVTLKQFTHTHPTEAALATPYLKLLRNEKELATPHPKADLVTAPAHIDSLLPENPPFPTFIATDCDGTTWDGDIGESLFERALKDRILKEDASPYLSAYLKDYGFPASANLYQKAEFILEAFESGALKARGLDQGRSVNEIYSTYYQCNAWCFAGHPVASIKSWTRKLFEETHGLQSRIFPGVLSLLKTANQRGYTTVAISASNQWAVEVGAAYLGIPPRHVRGIRLKTSNHVLTPHVISPVPFGPGKVAALRAFSPRVPRLSLGDSFERTDKEMLGYSEAAAVITPLKPEAARRLSESAPGNWLLIDPQNGNLRPCSTPTDP